MNNDVLRLIVTWKERQPARGDAEEFAELFENLQERPPIDNAFEVEDAIWDIWTDHADPQAASAMKEAIAAIARKNYAEAEAKLTDLTNDQPEWAEAWNKRATLYFLMGRDAESAEDIARTLELEPRHFGAIAAFAEICLRNADMQTAIIAMTTALDVNPHLSTVRTTLEQVASRHPSVTH